VEELGEAGLDADAVDEEGRASAPAAIDDGVVGVGRLADDAAEAILRHELEARAPVVEKERRLRRADLHGAVVKDLLQLRLELLDVRMHAGIVNATRSVSGPGRRSLSRWGSDPHRAWRRSSFRRR